MKVEKYLFELVDEELRINQMKLPDKCVLIVIRFPCVRVWISTD